MHGTVYCSFHAPYFLQARLATPAPRLDLALWQNMSMYEATDADVAAEVKSSILRHQWYLTQELVVLGLFDKELDDIKDRMAASLLASPRPERFHPGKPEFSNVVLEAPGATLASFTGFAHGLCLSCFIGMQIG